MKKKHSLVHAIFQCQTCGREWENYLTSQTLARKHAQEKRHHVTGELGIAVTYDATAPSSGGQKGEQS